MYLPSYLSVIVWAFTIPWGASLPFSSSHPGSRVINCLDLAASFDESCWEILDLSDWLNNPTKGME